MIDTQGEQPGRVFTPAGNTRLFAPDNMGTGQPPGRRSFLHAAAASTLGCALCLSAARAMAQAAPHGAAGTTAPHWGYQGEASPEHWGELSPDFKVCQLGLEQSPVDLANDVTAGLDGVEPAYRPIPLRIINNGHTIQVNADPGSCCVIGGTQYELQQFHFHHPSEHLLDGKSFDLECHLVHRSAAGNSPSSACSSIPARRTQPCCRSGTRCRRGKGRSTTPEGRSTRRLLPAGRGLFRYMGSLTTPPCSQGITWTIFSHPVEASPEQIRHFAALFPNNARPVQCATGGFCFVDPDTRQVLAPK